jgi:hypothetical protein
MVALVAADSTARGLAKFAKVAVFGYLRASAACRRQPKRGVRRFPDPGPACA